MARFLAALGVPTFAALPPAAALDHQKTLSECAVESFGIRDGLNGAPIQKITQTEEGFLWIGGEGGVRRYDGAAFVPFNLHPGPLAAIVPSAQEGVVALFRDGTISCLSGSTVNRCPPGRYELPLNIRVVADRPSQGGALWLGTTQGLLRADREGRIVYHAAPALTETITAIHLDVDGRLWIGTTGGLFSVPAERQQGELQPEPSASLQMAVRAMFESDQGHLWVLTDEQLVRIERNTSTIHQLPPNLTAPSELIEDRDGNVWIAGRSGLFRFRNGDFAAFTRQDGLPDDDVSVVFEDREGSLWVGGRNGSLAQFTDRTVPLKGPPSLRNTPIESLCEAADGTMWFGSRVGLTRWRQNEEKTFTSADGLPEGHVFSVLPAEGDTLWIGTANGLARWRAGRIERPIPFSDAVMSLAMDRTGTVWLGTNHGLARLRGERIESVPTRNGFRPGQVRSVAEDDQGTLWVTTERGLARLVAGELEKASLFPDGSAPATHAMFRDEDGTLWFGAGTSLVRRRHGKWTFFGAADGVPPDPIYQLQSDAQGYLWLATSRELVRMDKHALESSNRGDQPAPSNITFAISEARREIAGRRSRSPGAWKTRDGRLWFATLRGIAAVDPGRIHINGVPPDVLILQATLDGRRIDPGRDNVFPPGPGNLEVHFMAVTQLEPHKVQYRHRLAGFDSRWSEVGPSRTARYPNLGPGQYRFAVQSSNADGVWNQTGAAVTFHLSPHFYRTRWFYFLSALVCLGAILFFNRLRLATVRGQFVAVFEERTRVARELHDSLLQGIAAAALELENVREALPPTATTAAKRLGAVEQAISSSLEETRRVVSNLREIGDGPRELGRALSTLATRLRVTSAIDCTVKVEGVPVPLSNEVQSGLFRIAQEGLTNAIKHAKPTSIRICLTYETAAVVLSVTDNGCGFDVERAQGPQQGHFGLLGMRERAQTLGAELSLTSEPGQGTSVCVRLRVMG